MNGHIIDLLRIIKEFWKHSLSGARILKHHLILNPINKSPFGGDNFEWYWDEGVDRRLKKYLKKIKGKQIFKKNQENLPLMRISGIGVVLKLTVQSKEVGKHERRGNIHC